MNQPTIWQDITTSVHRALQEHLDLLSEAGLVQRSDTLLAQLPNVVDSQPTTTAMFLRRYHTALRQEVCRGTQPRMVATMVEDQLRDLTRAVMLTVGITEGVSVEAAVGLALVVYKRGVIPFCALPVSHSNTA